MEKSLRKIFNERGVFDAAPSFEDDFMFYDRKRMWGRVNCVGYALGYKADDFSEQNRRITEALYNRAEIPAGVAYLLAHTSTLPIKDNNLENIPEGHYPIAGFLPLAMMGHDINGEFQLDSFFDYHWYRMDNTGLWSHKDGWGGESMNIDARRKEIKDPLKADRYSYRDGYNYTRLMGFFAVPKHGATFFPSKQDSFDALEKHIKHSLEAQNVPRLKR